MINTKCNTPVVVVLSVETGFLLLGIVAGYNTSSVRSMREMAMTLWLMVHEDCVYKEGSVIKNHGVWPS